MKDLMGGSVEEGDMVYCIAKGYRFLVKAVVLKISEKSIQVEYTNNWNFSYGKLENTRVTTDQFIKERL